MNNFPATFIYRKIQVQKPANMIDFLKTALDFFLHLEHHLDGLIQEYDAWVYVILFMIIFLETGIVITPFLPGDSLLFAIGAFAARGSLDLTLSIALLLIAAITGDALNYTIGSFFGHKILEHPKLPIKKEHIDKTHEFYEKYGGKTIIIARFVPIVRTFAPFVAGIGDMTYKKFLNYNVIGALMWVFGFILAGYYFGNLPAVKNNFKLVILVIIILSILPGVIEYIRAKRKNAV